MAAAGRAARMSRLHATPGSCAALRPAGLGRERRHYRARSGPGARRGSLGARMGAMFLPSVDLYLKTEPIRRADILERDADRRRGGQSHRDGRGDDRHPARPRRVPGRPPSRARRGARGLLGRLAARRPHGVVPHEPGRGAPARHRAPGPRPAGRALLIPCAPRGARGRGGGLAAPRTRPRRLGPVGPLPPNAGGPGAGAEDRPRARRPPRRAAHPRGARRRGRLAARPAVLAGAERATVGHAAARGERPRAV